MILTALFLALGAVFQSHSVASLLTADEKSLYFGLEEGLISEPEDRADRKEKSLLNTFPFNLGNEGHDHGHHHQDHGHHHQGHAEFRDNAKTQHNGLFPFKSAGDNNTSSEETVSIEDFIVESGTGEEADTTEISGLAPGLAQGGVDFNTIGAASTEDEDVALGRKCIDKVMIVEETVYDEVVTCDHSYDKRCHTSYVTSFVSVQEEECDENFKKVCYIEYEPHAYNETVEVCRTPVVKDCSGHSQGDQVCSTVYETECWTKQNVHEVEDDVVSCHTVQEEVCSDVVSGYTSATKCSSFPRESCALEKVKVTKLSPETGCDKRPVELCAPRGCALVNGPVECSDKVKTIVVDKPVEECALEPVKSCSQVTKLVPKLVPLQECVDVPKEVCARSQTNPRKKKRPIIKKWCYVPSKESGLV